MLEQRIHQRFIDSADLKYQWAQSLARPVADAVQALLACITGGGKVLVCGNGASGALAQYMAALMVGGLERPRPGLPALALGADAATLTAVARRGEYADAFAAQVRALGGAGDALLVLSSNGNATNLVRAVQAAHEREMSVIALTGRGGGELGRMLRDTDVHVGVPQEGAPHIHEAHQLVLHCLCDSLDLQLLGEEDPSA
ncbi:MAG: SIS domain-containing protein [Pseudomonadota bacterium]|nr:SIS domain-containing protein [Pseudomonadota bacterium]